MKTQKILISLFVALNLGCAAEMGVVGGNGIENSNGGLSGKPTPLNEVQASISSWPISLPPGVPLAGYGGTARRAWDPLDKHPYATWFKTSKGVLDEIRAKVMVLKNDSQLLVWLSLDLVAVQESLRKDLVTRLSIFGINDSNIMVSATHTHSGPGAIAHNAVWELLAIDKFHPKLYQSILDELTVNITTAINSTRSAQLYQVSVPMQGLQTNRLTDGGAVDNIANAILLRSGGDWLGGFVHFPIHGTSLKTKNRNLSADAPGAIERGLEKAFADLNGTRDDVHVGLIQGAEGDVKPVHEKESGLEQLKTEFATQFIAGLSEAKPLEARFSSQAIEVDLGKPYLNLKNCINNEFIKKAVVKDVKIHLDKWIPRVAKIWRVKIGDLTLVTIPGEPTTAVGAMAREAISNPNAWIVGLTNDHMGYLVTEKEYAMKGTEPCGSMYGSSAAQNLANGIKTQFSY